MADFKTHLDQGIYDFQDGHFRMALESFDKAISLDKTSAVAYFYRGATYHSIEEYDASNYKTYINNGKKNI